MGYPICYASLLQVLTKYKRVYRRPFTLLTHLLLLSTLPSVFPQLAEFEVTLRILTSFAEGAVVLDRGAGPLHNTDGELHRRYWVTCAHFQPGCVLRACSTGERDDISDRS